MLDECNNSCQCVAAKCVQLYNGSIVEMESCYMDSCFMSKYALPLPSLIKVTTLYLVLFTVGVGGNLLTCIVIRKHPLLKTNSSYYLLNLALADLVTLCVGLPFEIIMNWHQWPWPFPDWVCNLKALIAETTTSVSILTILLFSIERYIAVCHPFFFVKIKKILPKYVVSFLLLIWAISIICSGPFGYYHKADYLIKSWPYTNNQVPVLSSKMCMMQGIFDEKFLPTFKILFHFSALAFFVFPLFIIFILYALIAKHVISSKMEIESFGKDYGRPDEDGPKRVTTILCAIVFTFFICYLPFQFQRLAFFYLDQETVQVLNQYIYFISGILFYLAPIINPIVYNVVSARFRRAFKEVLNDLCGRNCAGNRVISARTAYNYNYSHVSDRCLGGRTNSVELLPAAFSFRLINPQWEKLIRHVLIEANVTFQATGQGLADVVLLDLCRDGLLTDPFPQFICPLMELNSISQTVPKGPLDSTVVRPYNEAIDSHNHPCDHTAGLSCVVLFLPLNRMLFGCARVSGEVLEAPAGFQETFVVSHRVVDELECEKDRYGDPVCSLESIFVGGLIVQEQHSCCCFSSQCAVLYFDQGNHVLPFIRMVIDVDQLFEEGEELRRRKREIEWRPQSNGSASETTTDIFLCGGIFSILFVFLFLAVCRSYGLNEQDEQEAMAYGIEPEIVQKIFSQSIFQPSFTANTNSVIVRGQPSALGPALGPPLEGDRQEVIVSSDTMVQ